VFGIKKLKKQDLALEFDSIVACDTVLLMVPSLITRHDRFIAEDRVVKRLLRIDGSNASEGRVMCDEVPLSPGLPQSTDSSPPSILHTHNHPHNVATTHSQYRGSESSDEVECDSSQQTRLSLIIIITDFTLIFGNCLGDI
jgi:hypothetical protein